MNDRVLQALQSPKRFDKPMFFSMDWLNSRLAELETTDEKLAVKIMFMTSCSDYLFEDCYGIACELVELAIKEKDPTLEGFASLYIAFYYRQQNRQEDAINEFRKGEELVSQAPGSFAASIAKQMFAFNHWANGERDKAFALAYEARKHSESFDPESIGWSDFQLGVFHSDLQDYDNALHYFLQAKQLATKNELPYQLARINSGIASVAIAQNELDKAIRLNEEALEGYRNCGHLTAISRVLNDLGIIYFKRREIERGKNYLQEALKIRKDLKYWPGLITSQIELARIFLSENAFKSAEELLIEALRISMETRIKQKAIVCHTLLSELYKSTGDFKNAFGHLETGYAIKAEVTGEEVTNRIQSLQKNHATEKADQEAEIHRLKNVELKQAYDAIEDQNKSILDSINYARRIQTALLGSRTLVAQFLPENFILYKPKDIVSGDFWWCAEQNGELWFAIADCTGHGVPGAFMSLLNINLLNRALAENENKSPAFLLGEVRKQVISSLNREGQETARDGMDVVLCALSKNGVMRFACANNTLVHVRDSEIKVYGPDKFPVGLSHTENPSPFTEFQIPLSEGDCVYLTTDGFADQFGGTKGKKFKQKRLRELFVQNAQLPFAEQETILENEFESWRGNLEQVDDVLVMGLKF